MTFFFMCMVYVAYEYAFYGNACVSARVCGSCHSSTLFLRKDLSMSQSHSLPYAAFCLCLLKLELQLHHHYPASIYMGFWGAKL